MAENGCKNAFKEFLKESNHLSETKQSLKLGFLLPKTIHGFKLGDNFKINHHAQNVVKISIAVQTDEQTDEYMPDQQSFSNTPVPQYFEYIDLVGAEPNSDWYNERIFENNGYAAQPLKVSNQAAMGSEKSSGMNYSDEFDVLFNLTIKI